ncbi:nucleoside-diphosphate kinase [Streptomyces sp. NPDC004267]|uniref:nucleoside-diphosphate kinase n=1 Tax=Streptomyces sp. NPDC004267 TaxID=3364694 RepID=UPI0036A536C9
MSRKPPSGAVVGNDIDFTRWAVILCKPDAVERGLVDRVLERIESIGVSVRARTDVVAEPWQVHVAYRDMLADPGRSPAHLPAYIDAAYAGRPVAVALAHGGPDIHAKLRRLIGHTDPTQALEGTIRGDLGIDSFTAAATEQRLVRNLVHTSDDPDAARRDFATWFGAGRPLPVSDFDHVSVVLCKPDAVERGLVDDVLERIAATGAKVTNRQFVTVLPWQIHVHYWDLLVDADWFPERDIPACLDAEYAGRQVAVALAHGEPGLHARLRDLLGHFDPTRAAPGTIRGDLGKDSLAAAAAEKRLVRNLVHTSDDPDAARRDFGTWFGADRRRLLAPTLPTQIAPVAPDLLES